MNSDDDRPYQLYSVFLSFTATAELNEWSDFAVKTGLCETAFDDGDWEVDVSALPANMQEVGKYLRLFGHSHDDEGRQSHWTLRWRPSPKAEPPQSVKDASSRAGGFPRVLEALSRGWPAERQVSAEVSALFRLDRRWKHVVAGCGLPAACARAGISLEPRNLEWKLTPPSKGVHTILLGGGATGEAVLAGSGTVPLKISADILDDGEQSVWAGVEPLLERVSE